MRVAYRTIFDLHGACSRAWPVSRATGVAPSTIGGRSWRAGTFLRIRRAGRKKLVDDTGLLDDLLALVSPDDGDNVGQPLPDHRTRPCSRQTSSCRQQGGSGWQIRPSVTAHLRMWAPRKSGRRLAANRLGSGWTMTRLRGADGTWWHSVGSQRYPDARRLRSRPTGAAATVRL